MSVKLDLKLADYNQCTELLDKKVRRGTKTIEVPRALFSKLVLDNARMYSRLMELNERIT